MKYPAAGIFLLCLLVFMANGRPQPEIDCVPAPYTAWSLVRHASSDLQEYSQLKGYLGGAIRVRADGSWGSMYPPGSAWAALPFVAPVAVFRESPFRAGPMLHLGKLVAAVFVAGAAALFFLICRRLVPAAAWPATVLFAFGTCLYSVASQALWMHGPAVFWLCGALYFLTRSNEPSTASYLAVGFALGMAGATRPSTIFFALATLGALAFERRGWALIAVVTGAIPPAIALLHDNWTNFGDPIFGGYLNENWSGSPPPWLGFFGLLLAPSRGVLVYSPALILGFAGVWRMLSGNEEATRRTRGLLVAWIAASIATLLFYARWHEWRGGWCFGPRYLCETMPVACLLFGFAYVALRRPWQRSAAVALVALSVAVHFLGVFGHSGYVAWQNRNYLPDDGRGMFSFHDTQIEAHARALLQKISGGVDRNR